MGSLLELLIVAVVGAAITFGIVVHYNSYDRTNATLSQSLNYAPAIPSATNKATTSAPAIVAPVATFNAIKSRNLTPSDVRAAIVAHNALRKTSSGQALVFSADRTAFGDLNGDRLGDAVGLLTNSATGQEELVAFINGDKGVTTTTTGFLATTVSDFAISTGQVVVNLTNGQTVIYRLVGGKLVAS